MAEQTIAIKTKINCQVLTQFVDPELATTNGENSGIATAVTLVCWTKSKTIRSTVKEQLLRCYSALISKN